LAVFLIPLAPCTLHLKRDLIDLPSDSGEFFFHEFFYRLKLIQLNFLLELLHLEEIEINIDVGGADAIRAIGKSCPHLERVVFAESGAAVDTTDNYYYLMTEYVSEEEYESILSGWSPNLVK